MALSLIPLSSVLLLFISTTTAAENSIKSTPFLSEKFDLSPGLVSNKGYYDMTFPKGHIAVKSFDAEVVDAAGNSVPLYDVYLHHWVVRKYYQRKGVDISDYRSAFANKDIIFSDIDGLCQKGSLNQFWGLGSETRKTATFIPDPYGIETGNPALIPAGYEEKWWLNVHAIDTTGVVDRQGCLECRCDLYNVTIYSSGNPLPSSYKGGLRCCNDENQCRLRKDLNGTTRSFYLKYKVQWAEWDSSYLPVKVYILDITDSGLRSTDPHVGCKVEYQVPACNHHIRGRGGDCSFTNKTTLIMPTGGYLIYGVSHQHVGGSGATLYGQDGRVLCSSKPIYGRGNEAGNEKGYVVGMSTCYPKPGAVKIMDKEALSFESTYSNKEHHYGVMSLFYMLVADELPERRQFGAPDTQSSPLALLTKNIFYIKYFGVS